MSPRETSYGPGETLNLLERVRTESRDRPFAVAVDSATCRITYGDLANQIATIAANLKRTGCAPGEVIAVLIGDRAVLIAAMLGIFEAGCIFAPINDNGPPQRSIALLKWLRPKLLLTIESSRPAVESMAARLDATTPVLSLSAAGKTPHTNGIEHIQTGNSLPDANDPAYIYFTSGTTGEPKGIVGSLGSLAARIAWEIDALPVDRGSRVSQLITPTFDPWFRDIFVPLCSGGTICIPPDVPGRLAPEALVEWLSESKINLVHCGPTLLNSILSSPPRIRKLPHLDWLLVSGEFLHVSLIKRLRRRFGTATRVLNLYGATEATMIQFHHVVQPADLERDFIPIGRPLPDVDVLVIDDKGNPCRPGEPGEIFVGGPTLSIGYFRHPEATRQAFKVLELPGGKPARFYRTGDLGVEFEPGVYRLLGRRDDQIKIRGVRIEPREVEDTLTGYPLIAACAVTVRQTSDKEPALVAYVVPETGYAPAIPEMRAYLRERLPLEAIPASFVFLDRLPLTETGKVDRVKLPDCAEVPPQSDRERVAPRSVLEQALAEYWCDILGLAEVGVHDHFMDLGGHSLSAMRLITRLRSDQGVDLAITDILEHPTVAALAHRIETGNSSESRIPITSSARPTAFQTSLTSTVAASKRSSAAVDEFSCPREPSPLFGRRDCNLILFLPDDCDHESFESLAGLVIELDPAIRTLVIEDKSHWMPAIPRRPTLFFSPSLIRHRPATPGRVVCGYPLSKSEEYAVMGKAGIPVPRWITIRENESPDLNGFGPYVVRKPDYGGKGAEVRIVKRERLRWKPIVTSTAGPSPTLIVQDFVYTGPWPVSYRVNTLFGRVLYAIQITANKNRAILRGPDDFHSRGSGNSVSIVSNARDSTAAFCGDHKIVELGERAAHAFADIPMLGIDILKDANSGRLFVTEVNALGHNWNFGRRFRDEFGLDVAVQFDGLRKAAYILAEQTQILANLDQRTPGG